MSLDSFSWLLAACVFTASVCLSHRDPVKRTRNLLNMVISQLEEVWSLALW